MPRYLDPKADIVFKKIFGEHPELLKSFLNAVLPLPENGLLEVPEIRRALYLAEEAAYTPDELESYDKYWDAVSTEKTLITGFYEKSQEEGREQAMKEIAIKLLNEGILPEDKISAMTGLPLATIQALRQN